MAVKRSSARGDFKLRGLLRRIGTQMESELRPAMVEAANLVLETQRELIPVNTGAGRDALTAFVNKTGLDAQVGIRGKKLTRKFYYLRFVEYGSKGQKGRASKKPTNRTNGQRFFGYAPDIPAQSARPFLRPSYDLNRDKIQRILSTAIDQVLTKAAQS